jgi:hypothetical protein
MIAHWVLRWAVRALCGAYFRGLDLRVSCNGFARNKFNRNVESRYDLCAQFTSQQVNNEESHDE